MTSKARPRTPATGVRSRIELARPARATERIHHTSETGRSPRTDSPEHPTISNERRIWAGMPGFPAKTPVIRDIVLTLPPPALVDLACDITGRQGVGELGHVVLDALGELGDAFEVERAVGAGR